MIATPRGPGRRYIRFRQWAPAAALLGAFLSLFALPAAAQSITYTGGPVDFGSVTLGAAASSATISFSIPTGSTTTITGSSATVDGAPLLDFTIASNTCTGAITGPATCAVRINFNPTQRGLRRGALTLTTSIGSPLTVFLRGIGVGSQLVFSPDAASSITTVTPLSPVFYSSTTLVYDGAGNLYFNDILNRRILQQSASGTLSTVTTTFAGNQMSAMAIAGNGTLFVSMPSTATVYAITTGGAFTAVTFSGVTLAQPTGVVVDGSGNLYVADAQNNRVIRSALNGSGATVLPLTGLSGALSGPEGLAVDALGNLYIADTNNQRIVKVTLSTGAAAPLALPDIFLYNPFGLATDASGSLYIADTGNRRIVVVPPGGIAAPISTPSFTFSAPTGVTVAANGDVLVADNNLGLTRITRSTPATALTFTNPTVVGAPDTIEGAKSITLQNIGNAPLQLTVPTGAATNPSVTNTAFALDSSTTCPRLTSSSTAASGQIAVGGICTYAVNFTPTTVGANTGSLVLQTTPTGAAAPVTQSFPLAGTGLPTLDAFSVVVTPASTVTGTAVSYTVTAFSGGVVSTPYRGTITLTSSDPAAMFLNGTTYTFTAADNGVHTFTNSVKFGTVGTFTVTAKDGTISAASNPVVVKLGLLAPAVALTVSPNPVFLYNPVVLTAVVTGATTTPTGTVTFFDGSIAIGTVTLTAGRATLNPTFINVGTHNITFTYSGDTTYTTATTAAVAVLVADFSFNNATGGATSATVLPGATATFQFALAPIASATLPAPVTYGVGGLPPGATATFAPPTAPAGSAAQTTTLTITVPALAQLHTEPRPLSRTAPIAFALLLLPLLSRRTRRRTLSALAVLCLVCVPLGLTGCLTDQASGYFGQAPHTYTLTVTATSGLLSHTATVTLTVQ